eukprot:7333258-Prymnesium_polylepis.1
MSAKADVLAVKLLCNLSTSQPCEVTRMAVEAAVPPMVTTGVRNFVGSRSASVDTTFGDRGDDGSGYGFPAVQDYVMNLTAIAQGEPPILDFSRHLNVSMVADGLVGGMLPSAHFVFPVSRTSPYLPKNTSQSRYWDMIAAPVADMRGSREQSVWFRFQQVGCSGDCPGEGDCQPHGPP